MQVNNYDAVARFYDRLSRLVFGGAIYQSQLYLLKEIPAGTRVLVVGGGTGWILEEIAAIHSSGLHITYVEVSEKMIRRSQKRNWGSNSVNFITQAIQDVRFSEVFDVVITPFLLDNFSAQSHRQVFTTLDNQLKEGGLWLFTDFQPQRNRLSQQLLLKTMYLFFGILCRLEAKSLPDSAALFKTYRYQTIREKTFYTGFISSVMYQKPKGSKAIG